MLWPGRPKSSNNLSISERSQPIGSATCEPKSPKGDSERDLLTGRPVALSIMLLL
jgi:hypothetical protein